MNLLEFARFRGHDMGCDRWGPKRRKNASARCTCGLERVMAEAKAKGGQVPEHVQCPGCGRDATKYRRVACTETGWLWSNYAENLLAKRLEGSMTDDNIREGFQEEQERKTFLCGTATKQWGRDYLDADRRLMKPGRVHLHVICEQRDNHADVGCGHEWVELTYEDRQDTLHQRIYDQFRAEHMGGKVAMFPIPPAARRGPRRLTTAWDVFLLLAAGATLGCLVGSAFL